MASSPIIAIVDDDEAFRRAMGALLRSLGYSVAAFGSAEDFLRDGRPADIACLISDVRMPGMSGLELQAKLVADGTRIPIIFVAVDPSAKAREKALAAGALAFLNKPFREERLVALLDQIV